MGGTDCLTGETPSSYNVLLKAHTAVLTAALLPPGLVPAEAGTCRLSFTAPEGAPPAWQERELGRKSGKMPPPFDS